MTHLRALSLSRSLRPAPELRVLAVFERACDLATPDGQVIALALPDIGNGPLNIVIEQPDRSGLFRGIEPGMAAAWRGERLRVGPLAVTLAGAVPWDPRPDWEGLRRYRPRLARRLNRVRDLVPDLEDLTGFPQPVRSFVGQVSNLSHLAGLGQGLTPAGDDFLMGVMLGAWLTHPEPEAFCQRLAEIAAPRTTTLSAAMLRAAARGECSAAWHDLLAALSGDGSAPLAAAVERVLAHGHTSGADMLAGFLLAARTRSWPTPGPGRRSSRRRPRCPAHSAPGCP